MKSPWMTVPLVVISLIGSPPADADARIATVASALALKDGTAVVVRGAIVESAAAAYIVVRDSVQPLPALVVRPGGYVKVSRFQPVEVSGSLGTLPEGTRALLDAKVFCYVNSSGEVVRAPFPPMGGQDPPGVTKVELQTSLAPSSASGSNMAVQTAPSCPQSPPYAIGAIKVCPDGETVTLAGKVVTHVLGSGIFYLEEDDRSAGIKVQKAYHGVTVGDRVTVSGSLATDANSERYIAATSATVSGDGLILPMYLVNRDLGGGDLYYSAGPPASGQMGVTGGFGLNNIGLLVRTSGTIVQADSASPPQWYRMDDGSGVSVKVDLSLPQGGPVPMQAGEDDYVTVTGISSCEVSGTDVVRVIRPSVGASLAFDPPAGDFCDCLPVRIIAPVGVRVLYTVDGSEPGETNPAARVYDPSGCVLVMPPATIKARAFDGGCSSVGSYSATYGQQHDCGGAGSGFEYTCWKWDGIAPPQISPAVSAIYQPSTICLRWAAEPCSFEVRRQAWTEPLGEWASATLVASGPGSQTCDTFEFESGVKLVYGVQAQPWAEPLPIGLSENDECQCQETDPNCHPFLRRRWTSASGWAQASVTPFRALASCNVSADNRTDPRSDLDPKPLLNRSMAGTVYRGGLFVGRAPSTDGSGVARSFLKFDLQPATERLWAGSLNVFYTRLMDEDPNAAPVVVGYQKVLDDWDQQGLNWSTAPQMNAAAPADAIAVGPESVNSTPYVQPRNWCIWNGVAPDILSEVSGDRTLSVGLASVSEGLGGWAYFAKKEYYPNQAYAPQLLYATGAPLGVVCLRLSSPTVVGGNAVIGTVYLNGNAEGAGLEVGLLGDPCLARPPASIIVPAGHSSASFTISTSITTYPEGATIKASANGMTATADLTVVGAE